MHRTLILAALVGSSSLVACGGGGGGGGGGTTPALRYAVTRIEAVVGAPLDLTPVATNVPAGAAYAVTPALPAGLGLSAATGALSGTPTAVSDDTEYLVTAGGASAVFRLRVSLPSRFLVSASAEDGTLLVQGLDASTGTTRVVDLVAKPANLPPVTDLAECANPPLLAAVHGAATEPGTLVVYDVTPSTGVLVERGRAALGTGPHRVILAPGGTAAYVTDHSDDVVRAFSLVGGGNPASIGAPLATGNGPEAMTLVSTEAGGDVLVVANRLGQSLSSFRIDAGSFALSTASGSFLLNGGVPSAVASAGDGVNIVVVLENFSLAVTARVDATGALQSVFGGAQTGLEPSDVAVSPAGDLVLVANASEGSVTLLSRNLGDSGPPLTSQALVQVQPGPSRVRFDLAGRFAYVASEATGELGVIALHPEGAPRAELVARARVREGVSALTTFETAAPFAETLRHAYVVDPTDDEVTVLAPTGNIGVLGAAAAPLATGADPVAAAVAPRGNRLYVVSAALDQVEAYPLTNGLPGVPVTSSTATAPVDLAVAPGGRVVVVASQSPPLLSTYRADGVGALTLVDVEALPSPTGHVAIDPVGSTVVATAVATGQLVSFRMTSEGFLSTPVSTVAASGVPRSLGFSRDGRFVVTALETQDRLALYAHDTDGSLALVAPATVDGSTTGDRPVGVTVHPGGRFAVAAVAAGNGATGGTGTGAVEVLGMDATTGALSRVSTLVEGLAPAEVVFEPKGRVLYALNSVGRDLSVLRFDAATGALTPVAAVVLGNGPTRVTTRTTID